MCITIRERWVEILVIIGTFTKFVKLYPIRSADAKTVERKTINNYIKEVEHPKIVLLNHGTQNSTRKRIRVGEE